MNGQLFMTGVVEVKY